MLTKYNVQQVLSDRSRMNYRDLLYMEEFIRLNKDDFRLYKRGQGCMEPVRSRNYNSFDEFKREVVKLEKGLYLVHLGKESIQFYRI